MKLTKAIAVIILCVLFNEFLGGLLASIGTLLVNVGRVIADLPNFFQDTMKITRTSMFTGIERTLDLPITEAQLSEWEAGTLIQKAMPELSADEREFVMTGVTAQEWATEFGDEDSDQIHDHKGQF